MANSLYTGRAQEFALKAEQLTDASARYSTVRTIVFIGTVVASLYFANARMALPMSLALLLGTSLFAFLVFLHNKVKYERNQMNFLKSINERENLILNSEFQEFDGALEAMDDAHSYTSDLDIFGRNSLFQLVNRTVTAAGSQKLIRWMKGHPNRHKILDRQKAVGKLSENIDWCQDFRAAGMHFDHAETRLFEQWVNAPHQTVSLVRILLGLAFALLNVIVLIGFLSSGWSFYLVAASIAASFLFLRSSLQITSELGEKISKVLPAIQSTHALLSHIKEVDASETYLESRKSGVLGGNYDVLQEVRRLRLLLQFFEARGNAVYMTINTILLGDIFLLAYAFRWKSKNAEYVSDWIDTVTEFECIVSLAGNHHLHNLSFPTISEGLEMEWTNVGHPLIPVKDRVENSFKMTGKGSITVITGSNMSGKSTFLRTLGVNLVLAYMGGSVFARQATVGLFTIFTGMRVRDDLESHISSFYAELSRIEQLLKLLRESETPVFYVLDEILKGTNSADRHKGSKALISQLEETNSIGLVSTHDVELGSMANDSDQITNMHFESAIKDNEISFDYKIRPGICQSFNASLLMEKMGVIRKNS